MLTMTPMTITARNVNTAFNEALWKMPIIGVTQDSRNGKVMAAPMPVITTYLRPKERMLFNEQRDANPYFHVVEAMWMLAGKNDVKTVQYFAQNMGNYTDDGVTLNGAYGFRWRHHFHHDQIEWAVKELMADPNTRRVVIGMWDPLEDPPAASAGSLDVPCNTHLYLRMRDGGKLDMTVCNRSNDIVWGCYGANVVHMSFMQEFIADCIGCQVGVYHQISNNWHIYEPHFGLMTHPGEELDPYQISDLYHAPICHMSPVEFLDELNSVLADVTSGSYIAGAFQSSFIRRTLIPLIYSWRAYKSKNLFDARAQASEIKDGAIAMACLKWLNRRKVAV